ncbi:MAG: photosystem I reaction center subunit PsaK [Moorea sp. SIO2B7]|nr:photosystem I reaction center subunit PsaK [Moorena sp. SIO2B7]
MAYTTLLAAVSAAVPATVEWSPKVGMVMIICNIIAIAFGKATIQKQTEGPALPMPEMFGGMGWGAMLGTTSLGHILGIGAILGLAGAGIL